jgi:PPOX class probable FMN-dependent enzyme
MSETTTASDYAITTIEQLEALYGVPVPRSLTKEINYISDHYRAFIEASPFMIIASIAPEGLDCSPRGDPAGFVRVVDDKTVLIPDRPGNNRLDTLKNIIRDPRVSLLFLIPGAGETLRINGRARLTTDPGLCASFEINGKAPRSIVEVIADRVYFQCQKALVRSKLWAPETQIIRDTLPTAGEIMAALSEEPFDAAAYDAGYPEHMKKTIY